MPTCPQCHQSIENDQRFCPNCGSPLVANAQPPPQTYPPYSQPISQVYGQSPYTQPQHQQPYKPRIVAPNLLGESADPSFVQPTNFVQRTLLMNARQFATDPIAGAVLGAIVTLVSGLVLTLALFAIISAFLSGSQNAANQGSILQFFTQNMVIVFLLEHGVVFTGLGQLSGASASFSLSIPMTFLLAIPAISSVLGGFVAASTDYSNDVRFAVGRGASMGLIYGLLLAIVGALFGNISYIIFQIGPSFFSVLIYGALWGTLFGMVGGLIKAYGRTWRTDFVARILRKQRKPAIAGVIGGSMTIGLGLLLSLPLVIFFVGAALVSMQINSSLASTSTGISLWAILLGILLVSPIAAIWLMGFADGGNFNAGAISSSSLFGSVAQTNKSASVSLFFNNSSILHSGSVGYIVFLIVLIPIVASYFGGRVAARITGTVERSVMMQSGAFAGVTAAIIMSVLAFMTTISLGASGGFLGANIASSDASIGVDAPGSFLGMLILGVIFSTIAASNYHPPMQTTQRPIRRNPLFNLFDTLAQQPHDLPRGAVRTLLYYAMATALIAAIIFIVLMIVSPILVGTVDLTVLTNSYALIAGLLLGIPTLLAVLTLAVDIVSVTPESIAKQSDFSQHSIVDPSFAFLSVQTGTDPSNTLSDPLPPNSQIPPIQG